MEKTMEQTQEEKFPRVQSWTPGYTPNISSKPSLYSKNSIFQAKPTSYVPMTTSTTEVKTDTNLPRMSSWTGSNPSNHYQRGQSFVSSVSSILPRITTTKSLWKQPSLHHQISVSTDNSDIASRILDDMDEEPKEHKSIPHRNENWHELFYDLVFVAAAIQIGSILKAQISVTNLVQTSILFLILRSTWDILMMYQNRFDTADLLHYLFYLVHSMSAFVMSLHLSVDSTTHSWDIQQNMPAFSIAAAVARFTTVLMYIHVFYHMDSFQTGFRNYLRLVTFAQFMSGTIFVIVGCLSPFIDLTHQRIYWGLWLLTFFTERTFVSVVTTIMQRRMNKRGRISQHFEHMVHRQSVFILLISGEAIIQLIQSCTNFSFYDYLRGCLGFAIVYGVGICYYEQQQVCLQYPSVVKDTIVGYIWEVLHITLSLTILFFAVGTKVLFSDVTGAGDSGYNRDITAELLMTVSCSLSLIIIFTLRIMHKGVSLGKHYYKITRTASRTLAYTVRYLLACVIAIVPFASRSANATVIIIFTIVVVLVLLDTIALGKRSEPSRAEEMGLVVSIRGNSTSVSLRSSMERSGFEKRTRRLRQAANQESLQDSQVEDTNNSNGIDSFGGGSFTFDPDNDSGDRFIAISVNTINVTNTVNRKESFDRAILDINRKDSMIHTHSERKIDNSLSEPLIEPIQ